MATPAQTSPQAALAWTGPPDPGVARADGTPLGPIDDSPFVTDTHPLRVACDGPVLAVVPTRRMSVPDGRRRPRSHLFEARGRRSGWPWGVAAPRANAPAPI